DRLRPPVVRGPVGLAVVGARDGVLVERRRRGAGERADRGGDVQVHVVVGHRAGARARGRGVAGRGAGQRVPAAVRVGGVGRVAIEHVRIDDPVGRRRGAVRGGRRVGVAGKGAGDRVAQIRHVGDGSGHRGDGGGERLVLRGFRAIGGGALGVGGAGVNPADLV